MIILGIIEFLSIYLALLYLSGFPLNLIKLIQSLLIIFIPAVVGYFYLSPIAGIVLMLLITTYIFYLFNKSKWVLIDVGAVSIIGVFTDNVAQLINLAMPYQGSPLELHILYFLLIFWLIIMLYHYLIRTKLIQIQFSVTSHLFVFALIIVTVIIFYINVFVFDSNLLLQINLFIQVIYIALITLFFITFIKNTKKEHEIKQKEIMHQQFSDYTKALAQVNEDMQKFRHDYLNILVSLRGYIDENDMTALKKYFYENIIPAEQQTIIRNKLLGTLEKIEMLEVKSIIASKVIQADRFNIEVNIEVPNPISSIPMNSVDITRVLGIYLDNAIEASLETENPRINIALLKITEQTTLVIIENRYVNNQIDLNAIYSPGISTKGEKRGLGLVNARTILNQYENVTMNTRIENNWFIQEIQIS